MNIFVIWLIVVLSTLFSIGVALLLTGKLTSAAFVSYFAIIVFVFLALFFRDKVSSLKLAGNELQLIQETKSDIREYLVDIYKVQLLSIAGNKPLSTNVGSTKADNMDTLLEIHSKLQKYKLLVEVEEELKEAATQVIYDQVNLLSAYSQVKVSYSNIDSLPDELERVESEKSFEIASKHFKIPVDDLPSLYEKTLEHLRVLAEILTSISNKPETTK